MRQAVCLFCSFCREQIPAKGAREIAKRFFQQPQSVKFFLRRTHHATKGNWRPDMGMARTRVGYFHGSR